MRVTRDAGIRGFLLRGPEASIDQAYGEAPSSAVARGAEVLAIGARATDRAIIPMCEPPVML